MPSTLPQYGPSNFIQPGQAIPNQPSGQPPQHLQAAAAQLQNLMTYPGQATPSDIHTAVHNTVPGEPFNFNDPTQPNPFTANAGSRQALYNSSPAMPSSQAISGNYQALRTPGELPRPPGGSCCSTTPTESSPNESKPPALGDPNHSSPVTLVSPDTPEQPVGTKTDDDKTNEGSTVGCGPLVRATPQTNLYTVPATYATAENPMTMDQHARLQQSAQMHSQSIPQYAPYGITGSAAPSAEHFDTSSFLHTCSCGDNCQCIGCAAHPYNTATTNRVQGLADIMSSQHSIQGSSSRPQSSYGQILGEVTGVDPGNLGSAAEGLDLDQLGMGGYQAAASNSYQHDGLPATTMAAPFFAPSHQYLTMEYRFPVADANICNNITGACRCGEGCTCLGCRSHSGHNTEPFNSL
ncbi:MAG: hypothetical protein Q9201_006394 [Fulgogasparrea decipioides]